VCVSTSPERSRHHGITTAGFGKPDMRAVILSTLALACSAFVPARLPSRAIRVARLSRRWVGIADAQGRTAAYSCMFLPLSTGSAGATRMSAGYNVDLKGKVRDCAIPALRIRDPEHASAWCPGRVRCRRG
jgi:hypothetical protein